MFALIHELQVARTMWADHTMLLGWWSIDLNVGELKDELCPEITVKIT